MIITTSVAAQDGKTHKPMSRFCYKIYVNRLERPKKEERRRKKGVRIMKRKYISSNQLYKSALFFRDENQKLIYVKEVYPKITDKSNAIIVCDAFENFSHAQILWEYIKDNNAKYGVPKPDLDSYTDYLDLKDRKKDKQKDKIESGNKDKTETANNTLTNADIEPDKVVVTQNDKPETIDKTDEIIKTDVLIENEQLVFPDALNYNGNKGCDGYLADKPFQAFVNSVSQFKSDDERAKICMEYVYTYCFNTSQVMKLANLIEGENYRYVFLKTAYEKVYDRDNYLHVKQLLISPKLIQGINEIYVVPKVEKPYAVGSDNTAEQCIVSAADYEKLRADIKKEMSSTTRVSAAKRLIPLYKCLSAKQIEGMLTLFSLESDKLEIANFAYKYCSNRINYSVVTGYFTSQSSKNAINEYITNFKE